MQFISLVFYNLENVRKIDVHRLKVHLNRFKNWKSESPFFDRTRRPLLKKIDVIGPNGHEVDLFVAQESYFGQILKTTALHIFFGQLEKWLVLFSTRYQQVGRCSFPRETCF